MPQPLKSPFVVTDRAGQWVAGQRVEPGDVLLLTPEQADYEIMRGLLKPAGSAVAATAFATPRMRRGARRG